MENSEVLDAPTIKGMACESKIMTISFCNKNFRGHNSEHVTTEDLSVREVPEDSLASSKKRKIDASSTDDSAVDNKELETFGSSSKSEQVLVNDNDDELNIRNSLARIERSIERINEKAKGGKNRGIHTEELLMSLSLKVDAVETNINKQLLLHDNFSKKNKGISEVDELLVSLKKAVDDLGAREVDAEKFKTKEKDLLFLLNTKVDTINARNTEILESEKRNENILVAMEAKANDIETRKKEFLELETKNENVLVALATKFEDLERKNEEMSLSLGNSHDVVTKLTATVDSLKFTNENLVNLLVALNHKITDMTVKNDNACVRYERLQEMMVAANEKVAEASIETAVKTTEDTQKVKEEEEERQEVSGKNAPNSEERDTWNSMFQRLQQFRKENGSCKVPFHLREYQDLSNWVNNQKRLYNNLITGNGAEIIEQDKISQLEHLGLNWGKDYPSQECWDAMFEKLESYHKDLGNCDVPLKSHYKQLAKWVIRQRKEYTDRKRGHLSTLTCYQIRKLNGIGFNWDGPNSSKKLKKSASARSKP